MNNYAPASAVQSITFTRAGITSSLTPTFENSPSSAGSISLLDTFNEATDLIREHLQGFIIARRFSKGLLGCLFAQQFRNVLTGRCRRTAEY